MGKLEEGMSTKREMWVGIIDIGLLNVALLTKWMWALFLCVGKLLSLNMVGGGVLWWEVLIKNLLFGGGTREV